MVNIVVSYNPDSSVFTVSKDASTHSVTHHDPSWAKLHQMFKKLEPWGSGVAVYYPHQERSYEILSSSKFYGELLNLLDDELLNLLDDEIVDSFWT